MKKTFGYAIAEYKRKYGVDVTKVGAQVDYDTCLRIFNDHIEEFTGTLDRMLKRNGYVPTQNEYDAMVIAVYNRPALANPGNALDTLIKNNSHNREEWRTTILNEYKGLDLWNSKGRGWTNRINEEIELFLTVIIQRIIKFVIIGKVSFLYALYKEQTDHEEICC